jgi:hypothetical protein
MKHTRKYLSFASAGLVLAGSQPEAQSATIVRSLIAEVVGTGVSSETGSLDVLFDPVDSVSQLISISAGSVRTDEGGSMVISAILNDNSIVSMTSSLYTGFWGTYSLDSITENTFTAFPDPVMVKGLRFSTTKQYRDAPVVTLPAGTTFTFAVPEASTALLSMFGVALLAMRRVRDQT